MNRKPEVADLVQELIGAWNGSGIGEYPTIESFTYRERTVITARDDHPALHFEQRTWKATDHGEEPSHWESGLLRLFSDGTATLNNAQSGRAETMAGSWSATGDGWRISLQSTGFAGDERMIDSTRIFTLSAGTLTYVHEMSTTAHPSMALHLKATLKRA